jgi:hypothetical protein
MSRADSPLSGRMIFNVGARRSGTHWLQRVVTAHPEVSAVPSETHLLSHGIAPLFERFQHSLRSSSTVGKVYVDREAILDATRDLCDVVFMEFMEAGTSRIAERTPLSLVGPRPLPLDEDQAIRGWYRDRLEVPPGITGYWQVLGSARIPLEEMVKLDYLYIANWSVWGDVKLMLRTVPVVVKRRGL